MSSARHFPDVFRYLFLVGVAGTFVSSSLLFTLNQAKSSVATVRVAEAAPALRPSYLAPLPKVTARDFDVSRSVAVVVRGKEVPKSTEAASTSEVATLEKEASAAGTAMVTVNAANVRSGPSKTSPKAFVLRRGDQVDVLATQGGWAQVSASDGQTGWIWTKFLRG